MVEERRGGEIAVGTEAWFIFRATATVQLFLTHTQREIYIFMGLDVRELEVTGSLNALNVVQNNKLTDRANALSITRTDYVRRPAAGNYRRFSWIA